MDPLSIIVLAITVLGGGGTAAIIRADTEGFKKLVSRAFFIARANLAIKTGRAPLEVTSNFSTAEGKQAAIDAWEAEYSGKSELMLVNKNLHVIDRSWNDLSEPDSYSGDVIERWWWECRCGESEYRKNKEAAKNSARRHIQLMGGRNAEGVKNVGWIGSVR